MADIDVKTTPPDLIRRMGNYPHRLDQAMKKTTEAGLLVVWEHVPSYPDRPGSRYERTGQLGRSLGVGQNGGTLGVPDIFTVKKHGSTEWHGDFGSNLDYAQDVVGEFGQKPIHKGIWWTMKTIAKRAAAKVIRLYENTSEEMVKFLEGMR